MMEQNIIHLVAKPNICIKKAIELLDLGGEGILLFTDENNYLKGLITDGDVRRAIITGISLEEPVQTIMNDKPKISFISENTEDVKLKLRSLMWRHMPVVDAEFKLVDLIRLNHFDTRTFEKKSNPIVIMAGGKGTRLDPFTKILPKALVPLGDEPILEIILNKFKKYGFDNFHISVNHKAEIIKRYFDHNSKYKINFIEENVFMGTIGALNLVKSELNQTFFVSNCDTIIHTDHEKILKYHQEKGNDLTIVSSLKETKIPYGVLKLENSFVKELKEKPTYNHLVMVGLYVLEPHVLQYLPEGCSEITDLIESLIKNNCKVGVFPVTNNKWFDIGQWGEYQRTLKEFEHFYKE